MAVHYENTRLRISDDAVEVRGATYPLSEVEGLEETGFWGARVALAASLAMILVITDAMGGSWLLYVFLGCWGLLAVLLAYASFALKGLRFRIGDRTRALPGRFNQDERRRIAAAFAAAKAGDH